MQGAMSQQYQSIQTGTPVPAMPPSGQVPDEARRDMSSLPGEDGAARMLTGLASLVRRTFDDSARHKSSSGVTASLTRALEMSRRRYDPDKLAKFRSLGMEPVYVPIVCGKRRDALAFLSELFDHPGEKTWTLAPTPVPEVPLDVRETAYREALKYIAGKVEETGGLPPEDVVYYFARNMVDEVSERELDEARKRCARLELLVHDQMLQGGYGGAFKTFMGDLCTYGTAVMKGPVPAVVRVKAYPKSKSGVVKVVWEDREALRYEAVSPWDVFPAKGMRGVDDGPVCIRVHYRPDELRRLSRRPSAQGSANGALARSGAWLADAVDAVLALRPDGGHAERVEGDEARLALSNEAGRSVDDQSLIDGIEFFGEVRGSMLAECGVGRDSSGRDLDPSAYYSAHVVTVMDTVVFCRVTEPEVGVPLSRGVFYRQADGWFGDSLADILSGVQDTSNAALRDLCVNMGAASGPQVVISDISRMVDSDATMRPLRTWLFKRGEFGDQSQPVKFLQPNSNAEELLAVMNAMDQRADRDSGVPSAAFWQGVGGGAARTQQGIALIMEQTTRPMKMVVSSVDMDVVRRVVRMTADWNILYSKDASLKGDCEVQASGLMGLVLKEQETQRIMAFLQATLNEFDMSIVGKRGRAVMLRETIKGLGVNPDLVVPSDAMLEMLEKAERAKAEREQMAAQQAQQTQMETQRGNADTQRQNADVNLMRTEAEIRQGDERLAIEREKAGADAELKERELEDGEIRDAAEMERAEAAAAPQEEAAPPMGVVQI